MATSRKKQEPAPPAVQDPPAIPVWMVANCGLPLERTLVCSVRLRQDASRKVLGYRSAKSASSRSRKNSAELAQNLASLGFDILNIIKTRLRRSQRWHSVRRTAASVHLGSGATGLPPSPPASAPRMLGQTTIDCALRMMLN